VSHGGITESLYWIPVIDDLPDDDAMVLCAFEDADPWPGYRSDGEWIEPNGAPVSGVTHWADMPEGPA
jgi:hypothetical protein